MTTSEAMRGVFHVSCGRALRLHSAIRSGCVTPIFQDEIHPLSKAFLYIAPNRLSTWGFFAT